MNPTPKELTLFWATREHKWASYAVCKSRTPSSFINDISTFIQNIYKLWPGVPHQLVSHATQSLRSHFHTILIYKAASKQERER